MKDKMIAFLLDKANPSIQLRVKKEILHTITEAEERALQERILGEKLLGFISEKQQDTGFAAAIKSSVSATSSWVGIW